VLIVDDEENLNWSLVNSLRKDAYAADGATTGDEALHLLGAQNYDIVISDVKMPGVDGFELLQWLRANRPHTRVIMMTAFGSPTERNDALRTGAIAYLEKPFDLRALKDQLRRMTSPVGSSGAPAASQTDGYDLLEVARVVSLARRDIALKVETPERTGRLRFSGGELIWAETGDLQGDDAFIALTTARAGRAQPEAWDGHSPRNVTQPLSRLIPLVLSQRDQPATSDAAGQARRTTPPPGAPSSAPSSQASHLTATVPGSGQPVAATGSSVPTGSAAPPRVPVPEALEPRAATAPLAALSVEQAVALRKVVETLAGQLPEMAGVAFLRPDGAVVAQHWNGENSAAPSGVLVHLAACAQAALRALLLAGWGDLEDVEIGSRDRNLLVRRYGRGDRAGVLVLVVPGSADMSQFRAVLEQVEPELGAALR
jgi:CheY-like chemotaxis protein